jgi:Flp pilus assembly protein TadG
MNKIRNYWKNKKGITLVWGAFFLVLCLVFLGLAVDISYMYVVKNQLQVAADAAALAGAGTLNPVSDNDSSAFNQLAARQEAWKFACKNRATDRSVFLVTDEGRDPNTPNCDTPPASGLNETLNASAGDIVVGNWDSSTSTFTPATGSTGLTINALQARPRRTGETPGMPAVGVFIGQIFRVMGPGFGWGFMSTLANAIATNPGLGFGPFPLCEGDCGTQTPLTTTGQNLRPGLRWFLKPKDGPPTTGWTTFLDNSTSAEDIADYIMGTQMPPNICNKCIYTNEGTINPCLCTLREMIRESADDHVVNGVTIHGWKVIIPILPINPCPGAKGKGGCLGNPGYQPGDPYQVTLFAEVIVTDSVPQGSCGHVPGPFAPGDPGIVMVGTGPGPAGYSTINCINCNDPYWDTAVQPPKLVK